MLGAASIATVVIVVALWLRGRGLQDLAAGGGVAFTSAGRIAGLIAADLLLVQVLLIARVPWIERTYGQDRLARWHRVIGFTSVNLMVVHIVVVTVGYAAGDRRSLLGEAWSLVVTYPGMLLAAAGTAALIMVTVTSIRAARARLRYESWHLLHLYAYLGVGLSLPHQLWTGADFVTEPAARLYWWTAYGVAAGSIVVFRLGMPLWRSARHRLRVHHVVTESPGVVSVYVSGRRLDRLPVRAGQFFNWRFLSGPGWSRAHPYSLSAAPGRAMLRITVKDLGDGSATLSRLRRGTRVIVEGPYGRLTGEVRRHHRMAFIACGIGITPLRALLESEPYRPGDAVLLYRAGQAEDFTFHRELESFADNRGVRLIYLHGPRGGDGSWLPRGHRDGARVLADLLPDRLHTDIYLCGPEPWMDAVIADARRAGIPDAHLHLERFSW
jgi:predicted ferric reductase